MNTIAITGASGFIGRYLVENLAQTDTHRIKVLSRSPQQNWAEWIPKSKIEIVCGDIRDPETLLRLIEPNCTVVHLAYLADVDEAINLAAIDGLLAACKAVNIRRLIHCSTASVVGDVPDNLITEETSCNPVSAYGITKLKVEKSILAEASGFFEIAILRPGAIFGPKGKNLEKLAHDLTNGNSLLNYLRSCLFSRRRMNLVYVHNVVAAMLFLVNYKGDLGGNVFNISDDDNQSNNFFQVERILIREMNVQDYVLPRIKVPLGLLGLLLKFRGRDCINPSRNYSSEKLFSLGFRKSFDFEEGLIEYATWYKNSHHCMKTSESA
jgi:nucleoside-diphosphate-sugar epimerase